MKSFEMSMPRKASPGENAPGVVSPSSRSLRSILTNAAARVEPAAPLRVARRFAASPRRVFDAWLVPAVARRWLFATASQPAGDVSIDARIGGWFRLVEQRAYEAVEHIGEFVEIVPHRRLAFTLSVENRPHAITRVAVAIVPRGAECELALVQANVPVSCIDYMESRWTGMLYGLDLVLEAQDAG